MFHCFAIIDKISNKYYNSFKYYIDMCYCLDNLTEKYINDNIDIEVKSYNYNKIYKICKKTIDK